MGHGAVMEQYRGKLSVAQMVEGMNAAHMGARRLPALCILPPC